MSQNTPPTDADRTVARLFGAMLMAVGGLMVVLCGLCSLGFLAVSLTGSSSGLPFTVAMILFVGGIPAAVGWVIFIVGRSLWRGRSERP